MWIETEPFWIWHFVNAYESGQQILIDFIYHPQIKLEDTLDAVLAHHSHLHRIAVDLERETVSHYPLDDRVVELPRIDSRQFGKPYQFAYMPYLDLALVAQKGIPNYFPELIQYDVVNQTSQVYRFGVGRYGGEAIAIPRANATSEIDSYVITWVFDENRQASDLVILDAAHFEQGAIAQIHLPVRVPLGFHGNWIPQLHLL